MAVRSRVVTIKVEVPTNTVREALKHQQRLVNAVEDSKPSSRIGQQRIVGVSIA